MIQEKTRGNLTNEEATVLRNALSNLQMAFVEVSRSSGGATASTPLPTEPAEQPAAASTRRAVSRSARWRTGIAQEIHQELRRLSDLRVALFF